MASVAVFCPQSKAPGESYLDGLRSFLRQNSHLKGFVQDILNLTDVWTILASTREDIADLGQGPRHIQNLADWISAGNSSKIANCMSGILSLPLLVIIQVSQYFQYLELNGKSHAQFMQQLRAGGGAQGYCGGLLPAIAIACSKDEAEVARNAAIAMRIALAIGAYGELGDDESVPGATTIVVRLKRVGQGEALIARFPGVSSGITLNYILLTRVLQAYISAVTDPKTISIVGPVSVLLKLQAYAREQGMLVNEMHIRGKVHNPENAGFSQELCQLCDRTDILRLPDATRLQVPTRSNKTGDVLTEGSLTHEIVDTILASRCEWYKLLTGLAEDLDLSGRRSHTFATFGIGDCIPLSPFHKLRIQITKVDVQSLVTQSMRKVQVNGVRGFQYPKDAVAVIGASCRLPGANSLEELWDLISSGASTHTEFPSDRFDLHGSFRASQDRKFIDKRKFYGNFISNADNFDHAFFGTNPKEAMNMDPQQRVLLELAYQAMESSGYLHSHQRESGDPIGCFIGASFAEYLDNTNAHAPTAYTSTGTIRAFLCGKISYYFGWSGPSEVIDTACSSSLVAINRACKAVQTGECTMALSGGVNIMTGINNFLDLAKAGFLSPTGQCKPFDQAADGYCRSEGGGLVVLKLLSQALSDGDQILGVIPGTATNQGGLSASITIPHSESQAKLFRIILRQAGMTPDQVSYVETHGTGTQAGDPLEIESVREVFGDGDRTNLLNVGSLKGNIGHAETAAGVASLLKILTMIQNAGIPPQASYRSLNPKIPALDKDKMTISTERTPWEADFLAASVNSYGAAGSNAALICCEHPSQRLDESNQLKNELSYPIVISASSRASLDLNVENLGRYLEKATPNPNLGDVAFTLSRKRKFHRHVFVTSATDVKAIAQSLKSNAQKTLETPQTPKRVVLAFGGQTKRTVGMSKSLYESYPQLRSHIDECDRIVVDLGYLSLLPSIFQLEPLTSVVALQCGTFAMQYACAKCWIDAGLRVDALIGHSFGELTALTVSGVLSLRDGLKLIACRASLMETKWGAEKGTMFVVHSTRETVQEVLSTINVDAVKPDIEIACYNAPTSQVIVGSAAAIDRTEKLLRTDARFSGIRTQRLDVTHGFHSKFTEDIVEDLDRYSASLTYCEPEIPIETCTVRNNDTISATRPSLHAREPVHFSDAIQRIENRLGSCVWLEAGMDSPIIPMIKRASATPESHSFQAMKLSDSRTPLTTICDVTTNLWSEGISVVYWSFISSKHNIFNQIWLPPYQFQPTKHWLKNVDRAIEVQKNGIENNGVEVKSKAPEPRPTLVRTKIGMSKEDRIKEFRISLEAERFVKIVSGHAVRQKPLCPASMYMECAAMGVQLLQEHMEMGTLRFSNLTFQAALGVDPTREAVLTLENMASGHGWSFVIKSSGSNSRYSTHAKGEIWLTVPPEFKTYERLIADRIDELKTNPFTEKLMSNRAYGLFSRVVHYADFLQGISHITLYKNEAIADIDLSKDAEVDFDQSTTTQYCETVSIDTFIQVVGLLINSSDLVSSEEVYVATGVDNASMSPACDFHKEKSWTVYAKFTRTGESQAAGDIFVMTRDGVLAMVITGAQFTKLLISKLERFLDSANAKTAPEPIQSKALPSKASTETLVNGTDSSESDVPLSSSPSSGNLQASSQNAERRQTIFRILSDTCGAPVDSITGKPTLQELGVDSLSAVELKGDLEDAFEIEIEDDRFTLDSTVQEILDFLGCGGADQEESPPQTVTTAVSTTQADRDNTSKSGASISERIELSSPMEALKQCETTFKQSAAKCRFLNYWMDVAPDQDELLLAYICEAFQAQGLDLGQISQGKQVPTLDHLPKHEKVWNRLLDILEKHYFLTREGSILIRGSRQPPSRSSQELHEKFIADFPAYGGEARLMALTGPKVADCLTGKADPVSLMFRGAGPQKVMEEYYTASPMLSTLTEQMVNFIRILVTSSKSTSRDSPLRILEVGAGFGGTTTRLAEVLESSGIPVSYKFTDISPSLVKGAKAKFAKYPWMEFQPLNLEKDMPDSLKDTYDIVIGTNCVHATTNKTEVVGRLKSLLNEQGFIVLSEVTQLVDWYDIVFGLLDGWWLATDGSTYPLQPPESWMRSFEQVGFGSASVTYSKGSNPESNTQRLLIASNKHEVDADVLEMKERPRMQTVVYKVVDETAIEADVYLPSHEPAEAMPIGIYIHRLPGSELPLEWNLADWCLSFFSTHDPWRWSHDSLSESNSTVPDRPSARKQCIACQHRLPAISRGQPHRWAYQGRLRCLCMGTEWGLASRRKKQRHSN